MAIASVVGGAYTSSYGGVGITGGGVAGAYASSGLVGLGFNDENGYEIEQQTHGEMVDRSDLYGQSLLTWIHQGGSVFITFTCMTWQTASTGIKALFYPWGPMGVLASTTIPIGRLANLVAKQLILTVVTGTPAATAGPLTMTAPLAIMPPGTNPKFMLSSRVRKVPIKMALLPIEIVIGTVRWWGET